jgi:AraC-like DNA-binding protein
MKNDTLFYILYGAYAIVCLNVSIRMAFRMCMKSKYSNWQRRLYMHWGLSIAGIFLLLLLKMYIRYSTPEGVIPNYRDVFVWSLPVVVLLTLTMLCLTSHRVLNRVINAAHIFAAFICTFFIWIADNRIITTTGEIILAIYVAGALYRAYFQIQRFHYSIRNIYANVGNRTLSWMKPQIAAFVLAFASWAIFDYFLPEYNFLFIIISILLVNYTDLKIASTQDSSLADEEVADFLERQKKEKQADAIDELLEKVNSQSFDEHGIVHDGLDPQMKLKVENNLEPVCIEKKLYLLPDLTIDDLARELDTTRLYIINFLQSHESNFLQFINRLRVESAMRLLIKTDTPINQIVKECGFDTKASLDYFVKERYGHTAADFRKKYGKFPKAK